MQVACGGARTATPYEPADSRRGHPRARGWLSSQPQFPAASALAVSGVLYLDRGQRILRGSLPGKHQL